MKHIIEYSVFENLNKAKKIMSQYLFSKSDRYYVHEIMNSDISKGYFGKLIEFLLVDKIDMEKIRSVINKLKKFKLSKQIDTYDFKSLEGELRRKYNLNVLSKLKKSGSISIQDKEWMVDQFEGELDYTRLSALKIEGDDKEVVSRLKSDAIQIHKDWKVYYQDKTYLIYEILSYDGAKALLHPGQCIADERMYNAYKNMNTRFFNVIYKPDISKSIFIDFDTRKDQNKFQVFKWNDEHLFKIKNDKSKTLYENLRAGPNENNEIVYSEFDDRLNQLFEDVKDKVQLFWDKVITKL